MALACKPQLLIADEPPTALDITIQEQILSILKDAQRQTDMGILLITHDLNMVKSFADYICIMHQGSIIEQGRTEDIFQQPKTDYTRHLLDSIFTNPPLKKINTNTVLSVKNLSCRFKNKGDWLSFFTGKHSWFTAVDKINITVNQGDTLGIIGESGSGKTTLGLAILRLTNAQGEIIFNGHHLHSYNEGKLRPLRRKMQIVFQDPFSSLSPRFSIEQIIGEGLKAHGIGKNRAARRNIIVNALQEVGLTADILDRFPHEFSGGQRQRIAIARAIVLQPELIIFDEPTSALDMTVQKQIVELLQDLQNKLAITYIFISHDLRVIKAVANQIMVMKDGKMVETGTAEQIFSQPQHAYTKQLLSTVID
jgi:microcin C transport system ATP-binding protein